MVFRWWLVCLFVLSFVGFFSLAFDVSGLPSAISCLSANFGTSTQVTWGSSCTQWMPLRYLNTLDKMLNGTESCLEVKTFFLWDYSRNLELPGIISRPVKFGLLVLVYDVIAEQKVDEPREGSFRACRWQREKLFECWSDLCTAGDPSRHCSVNGYLKWVTPASSKTFLVVKNSALLHGFVSWNVWLLVDNSAL